MAMRVKNVAAGFYDATGFHPIRSSGDYDPERAGDEYSERRTKARRKKPKAKARWKRTPAVRRAASTLRALGRKRNPIPVEWVTAKVRKLGNDVQVMLFPKGKVAKRRTKRRVARRVVRRVVRRVARRTTRRRTTARRRR